MNSIYSFKIYTYFISQILKVCTTKYSKSYMERRLKRLYPVQVKIKIYCEKRAFKNTAMLTGEHLYWILHLTKLQAFSPATLLKRGSDFLWIMRNIWDHLFKRVYFKEHLRTAAFEKTTKSKLCIFKQLTRIIGKRKIALICLCDVLEWRNH